MITSVRLMILSSRLGILGVGFSETLSSSHPLRLLGLFRAKYHRGIFRVQKKDHRSDQFLE